MEFAPRCGADSAWTIERNRRCSCAYIEDFAIEDEPKMRCRWDAKTRSHSCAGPNPLIWSIEGLVGLLGIVVPALVMAAVVHRWVERTDWKTISFSLGLALVALGPSVYQEVLPVPVDEVARGYPRR